MADPQFDWFLPPKRIQSALAAAVPVAERRVWLDVGTSWRSLATWDLVNNQSLFVVGVDAMRWNLYHRLQASAQTKRFIPVEGVCTDDDATHVIFNFHNSPTCGTLLSTRPDAPTIGQGKSACTGDIPRRVKVRAFPLRSLLHRVVTQLAPRIELLMLDVQGAELRCLHSASEYLSHVDNILLEVQDATNTSGKLMYDGAPTVSEIDAALEGLGFSRQYCEWNRWTKSLREMNCLYAKPTSRWLWVTANTQAGKSMVSYEQALPSFLRGTDLVRTLETSSFTGERLGSTAGHGSTGHGTGSLHGTKVVQRDDGAAGHKRSHAMQKVLGTFSGGRSGRRQARGHGSSSLELQLDG